MEYLETLHESIQFKPPQELKNELPEQIMVCKHIKPDDVVLELGGSIGRSSCVINKILDNKKNHVVVEPNSVEASKLEFNRNLNSFEFQIEKSVISPCKLYSKGWSTFKNKIEGSKEVDAITFNDIKIKYNLDFNVLVIDNEGNFVDNLKDFPNMLDNIRLLQIEHDFNSEDDLNFFYDKMKSSGFKMTDKFLKTDKYGPGMGWGDGVRTDPIFVSVWEK